MHLATVTALVPMCIGLVVSATQATQPPIPRPGLFCCPPFGPEGLPLNRQQVGPYDIFCYYDEGTTEACFYDPGTGIGGGPAAGCPAKADANPHPPTCPI